MAGGALGLGGCVGTVQPGDGGSVQIAAVTTVIDVNGEIRMDSIRVAGFPYTYPIRAWGVGRVYIQIPAKPYVRFEGDGGWVIEPITPADFAKLDRAVAAGDVELPPCTKIVPAGSIAAARRSR